MKSERDRLIILHWFAAEVVYSGRELTFVPKGLRFETKGIEAVAAV